MATQQLLQRLQRPPSPTLTNPDLILPDQGSGARLQTDIPAFRQRPPSPSQILRKVNSTSPFDAAPPTYAHSHRSAGSLIASSEARTPPLSRRSSNLEDRDGPDTTPRRPPTSYLNGVAAGGSPAFADSPAFSLSESQRQFPRGASLTSAVEANKRWSLASSSVHSEDFESLESLKWPGFDSVDDEDVDDGIELIDEDEDEEEQFGSFPASPGANARSSTESRRKYGQDAEDDDDPYSPNALSRRADMILANAKKRLTVCCTNHVHCFMSNAY